MSLPAMGAPAPDFTLPSTGGDTVTLSALRGKKVLLAFFPLAFTGTKENLLVDLLSDFKREVSRMYGVLLEDKFFSNRSYFVIDRNGILRWSFVEAKVGDRRDNAELLAQMEGVA